MAVPARRLGGPRARRPRQRLRGRRRRVRPGARRRPDRRRALDALPDRRRQDIARAPAAGQRHRGLRWSRARPPTSWSSTSSCERRRFTRRQVGLPHPESGSATFNPRPPRPIMLSMSSPGRTTQRSPPRSASRSRCGRRTSASASSSARASWPAPRSRARRTAAPPSAQRRRAARRRPLEHRRATTALAHAEVPHRVAHQLGALRAVRHALEAEAPVERVIGRDPGPSTKPTDGVRFQSLALVPLSARRAGHRPAAEPVLERRLGDGRAVGGHLVSSTNTPSPWCRGRWRR